MAKISTSIELYDRVSAPINKMLGALANLTSAFDSVEVSMNDGFDTTKIAAAKRSIEQAAYEVVQLGNDIEHNEVQQRSFNSAVASGTSLMDGLGRKVLGVVGAYASLQSVKKVMDISDELTQTTARIDLMNDGLQTTPELVNMIYQSAQNARGSFTDMASVVAKFGNNARDAFDSSAEVVAFTNLIQKQMTIAGASTAEASNAMLQLSQALGSGVLRGDELRSIFEQAPNLIQSIADYMDVPIGQIRSLAEEGQITADIVKNAIFAAADDINAKFEDMPMTWNQVWTTMKNGALMKFQPVLDKVNELANNQDFQIFASNAVEACATVSMYLLEIMEIAGQVATFIGENWSIIAPLIIGIVTALALYKGALIATNIINGISATIEGAKAAALAMSTGATFTATAAQYGFNSALYACPVVWIIAAILALIVAFYMLVGWINKTKNTSYSATGIIAGYYTSMAAVIINCLLYIYNYVASVAEFLLNVFNDPVYAVKKLFANLANMVLDFCIASIEGFDDVATNLANVFIEGANYAVDGINWIIEALNKIPGVDIGTVGKLNKTVSITSDLKDLKKGIDEWVGAAPDGYKTIAKAEYINVADWAAIGYDFGAGVEESVKDVFNNPFNLDEVQKNLFDESGYGAGQIPSDIGNISDNTDAMKNSLDITSEDLKYLRDIAERDVINRFTTAEIKVEMTNNNSISSDMDLDGLVDYLANGVNEAMEKAAEGVHA